MKNLPNIISNDLISDTSYNECIESIEFARSCEQNNDNLYSSTNLVVSNKVLKQIKKKDQYRMIYDELESLFKLYHDLSERHKTIYIYIKKIRKNYLKNEKLINMQTDEVNYNSSTTNKTIHHHHHSHHHHQQQQSSNNSTEITIDK
jgi:hypothetical protein